MDDKIVLLSQWK